MEHNHIHNFDERFASQRSKQVRRVNGGSNRIPAVPGIPGTTRVRRSISDPYASQDRRSESEYKYTSQQVRMQKPRVPSASIPSRDYDHGYESKGAETYDQTYYQQEHYSQYQQGQAETYDNSYYNQDYYYDNNTATHQQQHYYEAEEYESPNSWESKHSSPRPAANWDNAVPDIFSLTRHNRYHEVEALLDSGIPVDTRDRHGNTILCIACQQGLKRIAKLCLRRGADINCQNLKGNTPLHWCYCYNYDGLASYLISKGANPLIRNVEGKRPTNL
mmetsp:Transcript_20834/g.34071  ORF Transcript_20834/g.34071 Transcript_20834/m.34071 type:complete len:276 (+) Transcript_20834:2469-3296(+)